MLDLKTLKILILEENNLIKLTTNSLDKNNPEIKYKIVRKKNIKNGRIATALENTKDITLVVKSGIVLNLSNKDFPPKSKLSRYHLGVSRYGVFTDHPRLKAHYQWVAKEIHDSVVDLSLFLINPKKWKNIPDSDQGIIQDKKIMRMPRYMNHKDDILFKKDATAAIDAFNYGVLGEQAVVHNYVDVIEKDTINMLEVYAYNFDKLQPFLKGLSSDKKKRINYLADLTKVKIKNTRKKMHYVHN